MNFGIDKSGYVSLKIYDALGKEVASLVNESLTAGSYEITWFADSMPSGIYYYTLTSSGNTVTKRMAIMK